KNIVKADEVDVSLNTAKSVYTLEQMIKMNDSILTIDYFAGSGTTGHATINLNRQDDGNRKYILVEMGEYFDTVTKPRIQKVIYSADWKNGKPVRNNQPLLNGEEMSGGGVSHIFQYLKLEQYEDSLNNIGFDEAENSGRLIFNEQIRYLLQKGTRNSASLLPIGKMADPFSYEMEIIRLNERQPTKIDLVTTFNFLLGIDVSRYRTFEHQDREYRVINGRRGRQEFTVIWRAFTNDLDLAAERDWILGADWYSEDSRTFANADNAFGAESIEAEFKNLMFAETNY
ncbi:MAG: site-specific DNA-methyltransferase, partial [Acidobacteriota bacterium]|nr:site-specific DNA-methyltransferase [Acidobacteriota bacterium]